MIKNLKTAYKIGFASALTIKTESAYKELLKYEFSGPNSRNLMRRFTRGYADGHRIWRGVFRERQEVEYDLATKLLATGKNSLVAEALNSDRA